MNKNNNNNSIKPLEHPVNAEQHTAIYKMHRYYARRPWNVFAHIIKHYTREGDLILDPFCGGGVTIVEALKLRRRVIGIDLNPLATFITKMEAQPLDIVKFKELFNEVKNISDNILLKFYQTRCHKCGNKNAIAKWYEWSNVYQCPNCEKEVLADAAEKLKSGTYKCNNCKLPFKPTQALKIREEMLRVYLECDNKSCTYKGIQKATEEDKMLYKKIEDDFDHIIKKEKLWYPKDKMPDGDRERDDALSQKGITYYYQLFTKRNLLVNSYLFKIINEFTCQQQQKEFLLLLFSSSLRFTNKMVFISEAWRGDKPVEWIGHAYWVPEIYCEANCFEQFERRLNAILLGKKFTNIYINENFQLAHKFSELSEGKTCLLLTQSSHKLQFPDNSVDIVITDPPFGGNVQYAELSDFWIVWLQEYLKTDGIIDNKHEAIQTRHSGFPTEKNEKHYEDMLYKIFKECHRVLKKDSYLVLTFHNKDINVWMSLHRAANRAGFKLPSEEESENRGIIYQPPIKNYTQTFHQKATGSMLGDFILTFKRLEIVGDESKIRAHLSKEQEIGLENKIKELIEFHGGADDNTIMTILIPTLFELGIFTDVASFNWIDFLNEKFIKDKKSNKWFTKELYDPETKVLRPIDYIPAEELTRNLVIEYLRNKKIATVDELLTEIYTKLVNSHRPGMEAIRTVLSKYCIEINIPSSKKKGYALRKGKIPAEAVKKEIIEQLGIFTVSPSDIMLHNDIIKLLANYSFELGKQVHIGNTEQRKEKQFKKISLEMVYKEDWGIASVKAFKKIQEIDLLVIDGNEIPAAFEVTTSIDTAREAINDRFRDLYAILPNTKIKTFVVVNDEDYKKAIDMVNSAANKRDGLAKKIKVIKKSILSKDSFKEWIA